MEEVKQDLSKQEQNGELQNSILSDLRKKRDSLGEQREPLQLDIPGYDGELVVEYKYVPFKEMRARSQAIMRQKASADRDIGAACDTLVLCCQAIYMRVQDRLVNIAATDPEIPTTYGDERLAEALGFTINLQNKDHGPARQGVLETFRNEYTIFDQAAKVTRWLQNTHRTIDEEFLGEG